MLLVPLVGFARVYSGAGNFTKWTQTLALLEVLHAAVSECLILQLRTLFYIQLADKNGSQAS